MEAVSPLGSSSRLLPRSGIGMPPPLLPPGAPTEGWRGSKLSAPAPTPSPQHGERRLKARLLALLGNERDLLGERIAKIYSNLHTYTPAEQEMLGPFLPELKLPWILLKEREESLLSLETVEMDHAALQPLHAVVDGLANAYALATTPALKRGLLSIRSYYSDVLDRLVDATSPEERAMVLTPKAQVCGDILGHFLIDVDLALRLLSLDGEYGRANTHGNHAVAAAGGAHFKSNAPCRSGYNAPGYEYAVVSLSQLFSTGALIAAPTSLLKITNVPISGGDADEVAFVSETLQAGYTIGYPPSRERPKGILLVDLCSLFEVFDLLQEQLGSSLMEVWPTLMAEVSKNYPSLTPDDLFRTYTDWMWSLPSEERLREFQTDEIFDETNESQAFRQFYEEFLIPKESEELWRLLNLLRTTPQLIKAQSLETLTDLPRALRWMQKLFPGQSTAEVIHALPHLLEKIDHAAFSGLCLASFFVCPEDGKGDNYMVEIDWQGKEIEKLTIVSIDNDRAFQPVIDRQRINLKCLLFTLKGLMNKEVHPRITEHLLGKSPQEFFLEWICLLDERNCHYKRLIAEKIITKEDLGYLPEVKLDIPLKLPFGLLTAFMDKFAALQELLRGTRTPTHSDIFCQLEPVVHASYQAIIEQVPTPLDVNAMLYRNHPSGVTKLVGSFKALTRASKNRNVPFEEEASRFFGKHPLEISRHKLHSFLRRIIKLSFMPTLSLPVPIAQSVLFHAIREGNIKLSRLMLQNGAKANRSDEAQQTPLHHLMCSLDNPLLSDSQIYALADLLLSDSSLDVNARDQDGSPALFPLINCAARAPERFKVLLGKLVRAGADIEIEDPLQKGKTLLETAALENNPFVFVELIRAGAGAKIHPECALTFMKQHKKYPGMKEARQELEKQPGRVGYYLTLSCLTRRAGQGGFRWTGVESKEVELHPDVVSQLPLDANGRFTKLEEVPYGRRPVVAVHYRGRKLFLKADPEMAGREYAVGSLHRQLIGHGTPETELFKGVDLNGIPYAVLASQAIDGENLQDLLNRNGSLDGLDLHRLHNLMLTAMLIDPEDGKPDNYIVQEFTNHKGERKTQLVCVDNDHAFVSPFSPGWFGYNQLEVKCILYCLDQMRESLDSKTREIFLSLDPCVVLKRWLDDLSFQQNRYARLFSDSERDNLYRFDKSNPVVISIVLAPKTVATLYQKLTRLQRALADPKVTPLELLCQITPPLGRHYATVLANTEPPLKRFEQLAGPYYTKTTSNAYLSKTISRDILRTSSLPFDESFIEKEADFFPLKAMNELETIKGQREKLHLKSVARALRKGDIAPFRELLVDDLKEEVISSLGIGRLEQEVPILEALANTSFYSLSLRGCRAATDKLVQPILESSPGLMKLDLSDCPCLTPALINRLPELCPQLTHLRLNGWHRNGWRDPTYLVLGEWSLANLLQRTPFPSLLYLSIEKSSLKSLSLYAPRLRQLSLMGCSELSQLTLQTPSLEALYIEGCGKLSGEALRSALRDCYDLIKVGIRLKTVGIRGWGPYSALERELIQQCPPLILCDLHECSNKLLLLISSILSNSTLTSIDLSHNRINDEGAPTLSHATSGTFDSVDFAEKWRKLLMGLYALGLALRSHPSLTSIDLSFNDMGDVGALLLFISLLHSNSPLASINLSGNSIGAEGACLLSFFLYSNSSLTSIDLSRNNLGAEGATALGKALTSNCSLTSIDLAENWIGIRGVSALSQALSSNSSLTSINLLQNSIGTEGAYALSRALTANSSLITINLCQNNIGDEGVAALSEALHSNSSLTSIDLSFNNIGDEGVAALSEALDYNTSLTSINLSLNNISDEAALALREAVRAYSSLIEIDLLQNSDDVDASAFNQTPAYSTSVIPVDLDFNVDMGNKFWMIFDNPLTGKEPPSERAPEPPPLESAWEETEPMDNIPPTQPSPHQAISKPSNGARERPSATSAED